MNYKSFLEIILATVKEFYGEKFDSMSQEDKAAAIMKLASDLFAESKDIMEAVAIATHVELTA